jgi:hypothetical protein
MTRRITIGGKRHAPMSRRVPDKLLGAKTGFAFGAARHCVRSGSAEPAFLLRGFTTW